MKTDLYTKIILTIIAVALSLIALQNGALVGNAYARNEPGIRANEVIDVNVISMPNDPVDVNIESCSHNAFYRAEPIQVKIQ